MFQKLTTIAALAALTACTGMTETDAGDGLPVLVTAKEPQEASLSNLGRGQLTVDAAGCLRHGNAFVIWPYGSEISRADNGQVQVTEGATGKSVLVGQEIGMSGVASNDLPDHARLALPIPAECAGPYKWGGPVMTSAEMQELDQRNRNRAPVPLPPEAKDTLRQE